MQDVCTFLLVCCTYIKIFIKLSIDCADHAQRGGIAMIMARLLIFSSVFEFVYAIFKLLL